MTQLILVLEENLEIQRVIADSLKESAISVTQESIPDFFVQQARDLEPDLIFLSNLDSDQNYRICREIRKEQTSKNLPIILLANAKDEIDEDILSELGINGLLRKPFEASTLKEQLSMFITLDENFGAEPDNSGEDFRVDMSSIDDQLVDIKKEKVVIVDRERSEKTLAKEEFDLDETEITPAAAEFIDDVEMVMDDGFEFELKLDEDEFESGSEEDETETVSTETDSAPAGLEQLKKSGIEHQYAESRLKNEAEKTEQNLRGGLTEINLEVNDFADQSEIWTRSPDLDQEVREGLTDISLEKSDFEPEFPKNLSSFEGQAKPQVQNTDSGSDGTLGTVVEMDDYKLEPVIEDTNQDLGSASQDLYSTEEDGSLVTEGSEQDSQESESVSAPGSEMDSLVLDDDKLLTDSVEQDFEEDTEIEDAEQFMIDTSEDEFEEEYGKFQDDVEIRSMVQESFEEGESSENVLGELENLSEQMETLESEEAEYEAEEDEFEEDLEKEELESEVISDDGAIAAVDDSDEVLEEFMVDELGDLLEIDEEVPEEAEGDSGGVITEELKETMQEDIGDLVEGDGMSERTSEMSPALEEEVFDSWGEAEDAFMEFDREKEITEKDTDQLETAAVAFDSLDDDEDMFEKADSYSFTENELKEIVTSSVQNALEKSIAASLVELAVSELKTQVSRMDQS